MNAETNDKSHPIRNTVALFRTIALMMRLTPALCLALVPCAILGGLISPAMTVLTARAATYFTIGENTPLILCLTVIAALSAASMVLGQVTSYISKLIAFKSEYPLRKFIQERVKDIDIRQREQQDFVLNLYFALSVSSSYASMIPLMSISIVQSLISLISAFIIVLTVSPLLGSLLLVFAVMNFLVQRWVNKRKTDNMVKAQSARYRESALLSNINDRYAFAELVTSGRFEWYASRWEEAYDACAKKEIKCQMTGVIPLTLAPLAVSVGVYVLLAAFGLTVKGGAGNVAGVMLVVNSLLSFSSQLTGFVSDIGSADLFGGYCVMLFDLMDSEKWKPGRGTGSNTEPVGVTLKNVSFSYNEEILAVDDVSLDIAPGERVAIVGRNGSGKTTLAKLILQLYRPGSGTVDIGGFEPSRVSALMQDYMRYEMSARENIAMSEPEKLNCDDELLETYRTACGEDLFIGLDEVLSLRFGGRDLSGGEWQRIGLARAFLRKAPLIVLDEPNSSIDAFAETAIIRNMFKASAGRTCVFITHRLTTTALADRILVMKDGKLIEEGTHSKLMALDGEYAEMYSTQSENYQQ